MSKLAILGMLHRDGERIHTTQVHRITIGMVGGISNHNLIGMRLRNDSIRDSMVLAIGNQILSKMGCSWRFFIG